MSAKYSAAAKSDVTSISMDVDKEEDVEESYKTIEVPKWIEPNSDEEDDNTFNVEQAWDTLLSLPTSQHVIIRSDIQKKLNIVAGIHLTEECAWKQIPYKLLRQHLFDEITNSHELAATFQKYDADNLVLIGYAPHLVEDTQTKSEGDSYVFVLSANDAKLALTIARNIESYEVWHLKRRINRRPRRWISLGSENEVYLTLADRTAEPMDVEIQAVYPLIKKVPKRLTMRLSGDARDGYTEFVPSEEYDNVIRSRITLGVQAAPECISIEQQTDPTFPTNAWAQYLYEITEDMEMDESEKEEEVEQDKTQTEQLKLCLKPPTPVKEEQEEIIKPPKPPPEVSEQIKLLLKVLEFNQVDIYRDDYQLISAERIEHCFTPYLEENIAFMNVEKCKQRYVSSLDWHSSQLVVASYAGSTIASKEIYSKKTNANQQLLLTRHPVVMWSILDNLNFVLEFDTSHEVSLLNFCPYNKSVLLGGLKNGQVIIWDLKTYIEKLNDVECLNIHQINYRHLISQFTKEQLTINTDRNVRIANITPKAMSHVAPITNISWMELGYSIDKYGNFEYKKNSEQIIFVTSAMDGTIKFWNLNINLESFDDLDRRSSLPECLIEVESPLKAQMLSPIFTLTLNEPMTSLKFDFHSMKSLSQPFDPAADNFNESDYENVPKQSLLVTTFYGHVQRLKWLPVDVDSDSFEVTVEKYNCARIHDGPVIAMKQHPFLSDVYATLSCKTFAIWKEDYEYTSILWRRRSCELAGISWSKERPGVLFLIRADGYLEIWDLLARDDDACLIQLLGCSGLTCLSEEGPLQPDKLLSIGDESTSLRMIKLPDSFYMPFSNELEHFRNYILREERRKKNIQAWEHLYYERHRDVIDAKLKAEADARKEFERLEKEMELRRRFTKHEDEVKAPTLSHLRYKERMKYLWDEENLKRILTILTTRRRNESERLESETRLEKERLKYEAAKRRSLKTACNNVTDSIAAIRARILPKEIAEISREEIVNDMVNGILTQTASYFFVKNECQSKINQFVATPFDYYDCVRNANSRRYTMNVGMSEGTHRQFWYNGVRKNEEMNVCDWGYELFLNACVEESAREPPQKYEFNNSAPINILDGMSLDLQQ